MKYVIVTEQHSIVLTSAVEEVTTHSLQEIDPTEDDTRPRYKSMSCPKLFFHVEPNGDVIKTYNGQESHEGNVHEV